MALVWRYVAFREFGHLALTTARTLEGYGAVVEVEWKWGGRGRAFYCRQSESRQRASVWIDDARRTPACGGGIHRVTTHDAGS
jgi:hypothetical protein